MSCHVLPWRISAYEKDQITSGYFKWADEMNEICDMQMTILEKDTEIAELEMEKGYIEDKIKRLKEIKLRHEIWLKN
ncbi:StAR-related lipid transfer protein 9, partial [Bienertia sinuspersici]